MELLGVGVIALVAIAFATVLSPRLGIASPLVLVALGVGASLVPFGPDLSVNPEMILAGVLPPLLYAAGVSVPATDFRRDFRSIGALSVALTIVSTVLMGVVFYWMFPDLSWPWAFALGAIVSPTDAVATAIVKRQGVSPRLVALLEGESLFNDAAALVLLRAAVAATASAVSLWAVAANFVVSMVLAVAIGWVVGRVSLWVRSWMTDVTAATVFSFAVPFLASLPTDAIGASGLVAAVVAGLVSGNGAARRLSPQVRRSHQQNWHTAELMLEGAIYLILGLELLRTIEDVRQDDLGILFAFGAAAVVLVAVLATRAAFVAPLLAIQRHAARRSPRVRPRLRRAIGQSDTATGAARKAARVVRWGQPDLTHHSRVEAVKQRLARANADHGYLLRSPLGPREGGVMVWAGMRGVVTVAAAQALPSDTPDRSLLVLIAYLVAISSLVIQGGTMAWMLRLLKPARAATPEELAVESVGLKEVLDAAVEDERQHLREERERSRSRRAAEADDRADPGTPSPTDAQGFPVSAEVSAVDEDRDHRIAIIKAEREALLDVRALGAFSSASLAAALAQLDAEQIRLEL
ncbi:cation:proton antiporter [Demequina aestuarii]|uniref:cation:proton antiporter n=1 Tax=Demequina aestuarii TaxID=327095 RepID=UPI000781EBAA|nr:sodium:proton antiporter [Demequina aestuarii]